jgi:hypothetical protein
MKYLLRLDDACETMDLQKWLRIEKIFDIYNIKPLIAVIPNNEDDAQKINPPNINFWSWLHTLEKKGWEIGLHGNDHVYVTQEGGINPIHKRSEFAGLALELQKTKIKEGLKKLHSKGFYPRIFVAPSHTFDENTLLALKGESNIRIISDTMALKPYRYKDFIFIPQQFGAVRKITIPGIYTFCYHPNTMNEKSFLELESFLSVNANKFESFKNFKLNKVKNKTFMVRFLSYSYFAFRKLFR